MDQGGTAQRFAAEDLLKEVRRVEYGPLVTASRLIRRQPFGAVAALALLVIIGSGVFAELVAPYDPVTQVFSDVMLPPATIGQSGATHLLGTDSLGRDVLSRTVFGARISLAVGVAAVLIGTVSGLLLGLASAFRGGKTDMIIQRVMDAQQAIPTLVLAMVLVAAMGTSLVVTAVAIGITQIPRANRVIRSNALSVVQEQYIDAAKAMGGSEARIIFQHMLPNVMATTLIVFSTSIGGAIVTEATLSFLGLAAPPPLVTWGGMLTLQGRQYMMQGPWLLIAPATALSVTVLAFNFLGDSIRDVLDPRLRSR